MATTTYETADQAVSTLEHSLKLAGVNAEVIEPSTRLKVFSPSGRASLDETITLRQNADEVLTWFWSWGPEIGPASEVALNVRKLKHAMAADLGTATATL